MAEYYMGQVMMTGFGFAQRGFAQCNGQTLSIQQNQAMFSLLGVTYGGNGTTNFLLPDLRGRAPAGGLRNYPMGMVAGVENVTLTTNEMPQHNHMFDATTTAGNTFVGKGNLYANAMNAAKTGAYSFYAQTAAGGLVPLGPQTLSSVGSNLPHANVQPFDVINFNIALSGVYPSRN